MKIIKELKTSKSVKSFTASLIIFLFLFIVMDNGLLLLGLMRENAAFVRLDSLERILKSNVDNLTEPVPKRYSSISTGKDEYYLKDEHIYYYPKSWYKPSELLLKQKNGQFYFVIFGDGSMATLTQYYAPIKGVLSTRADSIGSTPAARYYMFGNLWIIPLGILCIAFNTYLTAKVYKKNPDIPVS